MRLNVLVVMVAAVAMNAADRPRVVFDVDLTKGSAGPGKVSGGAWDKGWRVTGAKDERIVFDAGAPIANGYLEVSLTIDSPPWTQPGKINYAGLHEDASLSQNAHGGDLFHARTGNQSYRFSNVKAAGRRFDRTGHEPRVGSSEDWIADGGTVHTIRLEWRDGMPIFTDPKGRRTVFPRDIIGGDTPVENAYGKPPFAMKGDRLDPAKPVVSDDYDYWDHVDFAIAEAKRLGLYAIVLPMWGNGVTGGYRGQVTSEIIFDPYNAETHGQWLGKRYGSNDHVIWMMGGDRSAVYKEADYRPVFRAMAKGIQDGAGRPALMSFHGQKTFPQSSEWFHDDDWLDFHSIQHWPEDQIAAITKDWNLPHPKPTWIFEGRYEAYYKSKYKPEQWGEWQVRYQAWQTVMAGAFGHTYGHEHIFSFGGEDNWEWSKELSSPGARSMTHLAKFMNSMSRGNLLERVPDQSLIDGDEGKAERLTSDRISAMRTQRGNLAILYTANGRPVRVRMSRLAGKAMNVWWYNPRNGNWSSGGKETPEQRVHSKGIRSGPDAPVQEFTPPGASGPGNDWVLVLCTGDGI